jgi:hypothetical protein
MSKQLGEKTDVAQYRRPEWNPDFPYCIIVDIDGTVAHGTGRDMYDMSLVHTDVHDEIVVDLIHKYATGSFLDDIPDNYIIVVSARDSVSRPLTEEWFREHNIPYHEMYLRKNGDKRDDTIVKKEIYEEYIKGRFNVRFVLEDRNKVVKMWRSEGLKVLQVEEGDF